MIPEKRVLQALRAPKTFVLYGARPHDPKATINALVTVVDDEEVVHAVSDLKKRGYEYERAHRRTIHLWNLSCQARVTKVG